MIGNLRLVSDEQLNGLFADPGQIEEFLYESDEPAPDEEEDLDKAWHGIHFLLTGSAWGGERPLMKAFLDRAANESSGLLVYLN